MESLHIREAAALHQEALDLRSFLDMHEFRQHEKSTDEPRSPTPTDDLRDTRSGIVLFDPCDFDLDCPLDGRASTKRGLYQLQIGDNNEDEHEDNQETHEEEEATGKARLRNKAIAEICSTERNYVRDIRTLHDYYIVPLEDNKHPIMEDAQIAVFFNNLRQLVMLNSKLLNDLLDIVEKRGGVVPISSPVYLKNGHESTRVVTSPVQPSEGIGAVFCRYAPLFKLYGGYAKDFEEVAGLIQSYKRDSRLGFGQFLESCQTRSGSDKGFESLLIMPIQRIPRYKLLLERICEYTPSGHHDELFLKEAVKGVSFAASLINETIRNQENLETVLEAQKKFVGQLSLCTPNRRLIRSGKLIKMSTKRQEQVVLHLFNDILLYSGVLITGDYRVRRVVQLNSKAVGVRAQMPSSHISLFEQRNLREECGFVVTSPEKTFVLFASSPEECATWVTDIGGAIIEAQKNVGPSSSSATPADAAALWVPDALAGSCAVCQASFKLYFRRHHCRRCGAVVCGNCSEHRSILFVGDNGREERVCTPCFRVLHLVKSAALKWLSLAVTFKGVLRRKRWNKWSEHYYELKDGRLKQYTLASASGMNYKCCTDTLDLTGAIVIHRSDERAQKYQFSFHISTSEMFDQGSDSTTSPINDEESNTTSRRRMSPLKAAVSRFGDVSRSRESLSTLSSEGSLNNLARQPNHDATGWTLCAASYEEESEWSNAVQRSADKALLRSRRSRVTEHAFPIPFEHTNSMPMSPTSTPSEIDLFVDDSAKLEHRRLQIMKEIVRSEESYVSCLGECIRVFVQPLLLRQLEAQKMLRRRQSKRKKSLLSSFSSSNALSTAASLTQRGNMSNLSSIRKFTGGVSRSLTGSDNRSIGNPVSSTVILDADMAIFFSSIDQICTLNQQLLEHLSRHLDETANIEGDRENITRPGAIFNAYAPLFQLYTSYASRHEGAQNAIESQQFAGFFKDLPEEAGLHRLRTYLNMPMERIPRYKVFLQELMECTPSDHLDYGPLQTAMKSVDTVANTVQEIIARRESARKMEEIGSKIGIDLRGKRFVKEGSLKKVCRSKVQKYDFVLLEDSIVYGRKGSGLHKKKFRLIDLTGCRVSDDTESIPKVINAVTGGTTSHNTAFYFFSPLKSFILVADSEDEKAAWMSIIQSSIDKALRGPRHSRRASVRSELLLDEEESANDYELESAFVIKNGWLNVVGENNTRSRRMWITLNMQSVTIALNFKGVQPEETISIGSCEAVPMKESNFFRIYVQTENNSKHAVDRQAFTFETDSSAEREEWLRALHHCISGSIPDTIELRRASLSSTALAPIFMFNKVSSACTICYHTFAVYRPRHHCRFCGSLVCGNCSKRRWPMSYNTPKKTSRICDVCVETPTRIVYSQLSDSS
ncbi:hypothetical protein Poli38472_006760 [Pythium oligandrum]|uniref:Uncharacterized protein n=1 Tax=Pythium oligandrum TaxID=41045 RepID=A0A8K1C5J7_PYTOL|nr:hypothetical protein Poli38472_006760 [Pythium oligandrum]|eukprot:TMW56750.1 hypothetical protein Poli38472_006760 [Pythium oligandrum]